MKNTFYLINGKPQHIQTQASLCLDCLFALLHWKSLQLTLSPSSSDNFSNTSMMHSLIYLNLIYLIHHSCHPLALQFLLILVFESPVYQTAKKDCN